MVQTHQQLRLVCTTALKLIANQNESGLNTLYDSTSAYAYSLALSILKDPANAEAVTVAVYKDVWRGLLFYNERSDGNAFEWLMLATRQKALDRLRISFLKRSRASRNQPLFEEPRDIQQPQVPFRVKESESPDREQWVLIAGAFCQPSARIPESFVDRILSE